ERATDAIRGLVEDDVVFEGVGASYIVVVCVSCPPDDAAGAILGARDRLEFHLDESVADARALFQSERVGGLAGLFQHGAAAFILLDRPLGRAFPGHGQKPASRRAAYSVSLEGCSLCR